MLDGSLEGAAKAAKQAANPKKPSPPKRQPDEPIDVDSEPVDAPEKSKPDFGKCPNCAGDKWTKDDNGVVCDKCHHPYGEPAGDADEDRVKTQRQKTVKTGKALLRAFDDLQTIKATSDYDEAVTGSKRLVLIAEGWK